MNAVYVRSVTWKFLNIIAIAIVFTSTTSRAYAQYNATRIEAFASGLVTIGKSGIHPFAGVTVNGQDFDSSDTLAFDARDMTKRLSVAFSFTAGCAGSGEVGDQTSSAEADVQAGGEAVYQITGPPRSEPYNVYVFVQHHSVTNVFASAFVDQFAETTGSTLYSIGTGVSLRGRGELSDTKDDPIELGAGSVVIDTNGNGTLTVPFSGIATSRVDSGLGLNIASAGTNLSYELKPVRIEGPDGTTELIN